MTKKSFAEYLGWNEEILNNMERGVMLPVGEECGVLAALAKVFPNQGVDLCNIAMTALNALLAMESQQQPNALILAPAKSEPMQAALGPLLK